MYCVELKNDPGFLFKILERGLKNNLIILFSPNYCQADKVNQWLFFNPEIFVISYRT